MRAYVFWHQPRPGSDLRNYELAVHDFHEALRRASDSVEGFRSRTRTGSTARPGSRRASRTKTGT